MNEQTLVAVSQTSRSTIEYLARSREELVETLDRIRMDIGDTVTIKMEYVANSELALLPETTAQMVADYEAESD